MKKIDLILLFLYTIPVYIMADYTVTYIDSYNSAEEEAAYYFIGLQAKTIKTVVIRNTDVKMVVVKESRGLTGDFEFSGELNVKNIAAFQVLGDTLFIGNGEIEARDLKLQVANHVQVDTIHAPDVTFMINPDIQ